MTQDEMIAMLATIGVAPHERCPVDWTGYVIVFQRFAELVAEKAAARANESCAVLVLDKAGTTDYDYSTCINLADAIRARGQKGGV